MQYLNLLRTEKIVPKNEEEFRKHVNLVETYQYAEVFDGCGMTVDAWVV